MAWNYGITVFCGSPEDVSCLTRWLQASDHDKRRQSLLLQAALDGTLPTDEELRRLSPVQLRQWIDQLLEARR